MSPVFRHGRLRLYLLKLLDEAPRHGYEVIRLLQDRFLGVYAPSPGTIYPRLARLEEDGLVTHEEINGKKVYSITDKGREEIRGRLGELADLEDELTESLRDVAREISEDVRDTVRSIREELVSAARDMHPGGTDKSEAADATQAGPQDGSAEARRIRDEARRSREQMRAGFRARSRGGADWAAWQQRTGRPDWASWAPWADWSAATSEDAPPEAGTDDSRASSGRRGRGTESGPTGGTAGEGAGDSGARRQGAGRGRRAGPNPFSDLERMAIQFATELRAAARQTGGLGERSLSDLRDILTDTLARVRDEVLNPADDTRRDARKPAGPADAQPDAATGSSPAAGAQADGKDETAADSEQPD